MKDANILKEKLENVKKEMVEARKELKDISFELT